MKNAIIIVDSSVIVKWLNDYDEKDVNKADQLLVDFQNKKIEIYVPELVKYEIGNALLNKGMNIVQTQKALEYFYLIPLKFIIEDTENSNLTIRIAREEKITYYDACFISLAIKLKGMLVTANPKHQKIDKHYKIIDLKGYS